MVDADFCHASCAFIENIPETEAHADFTIAEASYFFCVVL